MDTRFLRSIDKLVGKLFTTCLAPLRSPCKDSRTTKILFIRPGGLGDALLLLPVIEALAKTRVDVEIDILAEARNRAAYAFLKGQHQVELYTDPGAFFRLRKKRYDVIIDTEQWYRLSSVYARLLSPKRLIGFSTNTRARLLTDKVNYSLDDYEVENFFRLLEPLGVVVDSANKKPEIVLEQNVINKAKRLFGHVDADSWVAVFPGASVPEKCWPTKNYSQLINELQRAGRKVVIVGGEDEREVGATLESATGCTNLIGKTSLAETGAVLVNTHLLISGDSALLHLAAALDVPTVSLFGPSSPAKWAPRGEKHIFLQKEFECVPCSRYGHIPSCPYHVKCINSILPEEVLASALALLER